SLSTYRLNVSGAIRCQAVGTPRTVSEHPSTIAPVLRTLTRNVAVSPGRTSTSGVSSLMASDCCGRSSASGGGGRKRPGGWAVTAGSGAAALMSSSRVALGPSTVGGRRVSGSTTVLTASAPTTPTVGGNGSLCGDRSAGASTEALSARGDLPRNHVGP